MRKENRTYYFSVEGETEIGRAKRFLQCKSEDGHLTPIQRFQVLS